MESQEVVIKLTEEQREQISTVMGKKISSLLLIERCYGEPATIWEGSESRGTRLTTISST